MDKWSTRVEGCDAKAPLVTTFISKRSCDLVCMRNMITQMLPAARINPGLGGLFAAIFHLHFTGGRRKTSLVWLRMDGYRETGKAAHGNSQQGTSSETQTCNLSNMQIVSKLDETPKLQASSSSTFGLRTKREVSWLLFMTCPKVPT